tara:strand:- start:212 stop:724 length:513 start_codon:yes stop_codon:yes gene_type:complete
MTSRVIFALFAIAAGAALWFAQPGRIDSMRDHHMSTRCSMIRAAISSLSQGELAVVRDNSDVERAMQSHSPLAIRLSLLDSSGACPDLPPTIWMDNAGSIILERGAPDRPIGENDPGFAFGRHDTSPLGRTGSLELNFFCGNLCGQYWRLDLARRSEGWQVTSIEHTGTS